MAKVRVKAIDTGDTVLHRVVEGIGKNEKPVMSGKYPSDGGGFADRKKADNLAAQINARRARKAEQE